ncbi:hypothetical protein B0H14DRAFT_2600146 [Mycena olivaceomarginata]|nr:hypothetical protein B0H14DRAFT_2600146 [Mycena olivaceomarginata]
MNTSIRAFLEKICRGLPVAQWETMERKFIRAIQMTGISLGHSGPIQKATGFRILIKLSTFLTDVLFSSPRLRFSRARQQAVLSWAKDLGADVPSYTKFRKTQDIILEEVGDPTTRHESSRGNVWYLNEIGDSIKKVICCDGVMFVLNFENRMYRILSPGQICRFYPEDAGNKLGEVWHGEKMMRDTPDHLLSPNIRHNGKMYYVNELVQRTDGSWFLPKRWVTRNNGKVMLASGYNVND